MNSVVFLTLHHSAGESAVEVDDHVRGVARQAGIRDEAALVRLMLRKREILLAYPPRLGRRVLLAYLFDTPFPDEVTLADLEEWLSLTRQVRAMAGTPLPGKSPSPV